MPIPTPGVQLVTLTHVEDVASMLAAVPGNPAAVRQYFNVCSDRAITFDGGWAAGGQLRGGWGEIGVQLGKALAKDPTLVHCCNPSLDRHSFTHSLLL